MNQAIIFTFFYLCVTSCTVTHLAAKNSPSDKVTLLDQITLNYSDKNGIPFGGISDLAYNVEQKQLYLVGDRGYLYTFYANFNHTITKLEYQNAYSITNRSNKVTHCDSEGLDFNEKGELIVALEHKAQISTLSLQGKLGKDYKVPKKLHNINIYRTPNSMFESVTYHPKYGVLTAAEYPIYFQKNTDQTIYALDGKEWHFRAESYPNNAITALEVMDDNNLLVLERAYNGLSNPFYITLKKVYLDRCDKKQQCASEVLLTFDSFSGFSFGNYEGLAKVSKNRYIMVSDNNNHPLVSTTLAYFEVKP